MVDTKHAEDWKALCILRHKEIDEKLNRILTILDGNGGVGLVAEVERMKEKTKVLEAELSRGTQKFDRIDSRLSSLMILVVILALTSGSTFALKIAEMIVTGKI